MPNSSLVEAMTQETMMAHPQIVGGTRVPEGKYPYHAVLLWDGMCGASLIHPEVLLTAGHCWDEFIDNNEVAIGTIDRDDDRDMGDTMVFRTVVQTLLHPDYNDELSDNDFALLKLEEPVTAFAPVKLNMDKDLPANRETVTIMGFGDVVDDGDVPDGMLEADVKVVSQRACRAMYWEPGPSPITDNMFCAGLMRGGRDTCNGDSGGPVVTKDGVQVGVTSWGDGCAKPLKPGVYARVSSAMDFIQGGICALADKYRPANCDSNVFEALGNGPH